VNQLQAAPPFAVEQAVTRLGTNLRTARLRRNLTLKEVAQKIGTGTRAVADAERGKLTTGIAVYAALLWAYGLLEPLQEVGAPERDEEGRTLARAREPDRARHKSDLSDDF
jgi:transcriptional regulator with XRE-family HTH domain